MSHRWSIAALLLVAFTAGSGCHSSQKSEGPQPAAGLTLAKTKVDTAALVADLHGVLDLIYIRMIGVADEVTDGSENAAAREAALRLKIRVAATTQVIAAQPDPRLAFCDIWIVIVEGRNLFATKAQKEIFGEFQPRLIKVADELEAEVVAVGRRHFGDAMMKDAKPQIEKLAADNALSGRFVTGFVLAGSASTSDGQAVSKILGMPLAPLTGLQGVADTPSAITQSTAIAANLIQNLPERARWEAEMLLPEIREQAEMVVSKVRQEVDSVIDELNASQGPLQQTLKEAKETVAQVDDVMDKADRLATTADDIAGRLKEAAVAWDDTAKSVNVLIGSVQQLVDSTAKKPQPDSGEQHDSASVQDYLGAVTDIREAATQLNAAIGRLESDKLGQVIAGVQGVSESTVADTAAHVGALLNAMTVRAIIVIGVLLAAMIMYRAASVRLTRSAR
jgi:methyl-accepting chemotaxis protein